MVGFNFNTIFKSLYRNIYLKFVQKCDKKSKNNYKIVFRKNCVPFKVRNS